MDNFLQPFLEELKPQVTGSCFISGEHADVNISEGARSSTFRMDSKIFLHGQLNGDEQEKFKTLLYNGTWPPSGSVMDIEDVSGFIDSNFPPDTPLEKQDRVLDFFRSQCPHDGYRVDYDRTAPESLISWRKAYVENLDEFLFYLESLIDSGYLYVQDRYPGVYAGMTLTIAGLNKLVSFDEKKRSKTCFVAMSFSEELRPIYEKAIAPAIKETGFEPLKIDDETRIGSEQTINDAILAGIKKSLFTIADFTKHRAGVYFEAGYALGRGHKVIYTCKEDNIGEAHFDTRNYPHLVWKDAEDLKQKLIDKIEVFIKG